MPSLARLNVAMIVETDSDETQIPNLILNQTWSKDYIQSLFQSLLYHQNNTFMYSLNKSGTGIHELNKSEKWMADMNLTPSNLKDAAKGKTEFEDLRFLTDESLLSRGPLVFLLVLMMMVGGTMNAVVALVFLKRFPANALRSFIVTMSVSDLVATLVGIPCYIYAILNAYNFYQPALCKFSLAITSLSTNSSSFVIVMFAVDRLRRMQSPTFKKRDKFRSYYLMAFVVLLASVVTAPFVPLFGIYKVPTYSNHMAQICWIDNQYKNSNYQSIYTAVLGATFGLGFSLLAFSYGTIGYKIYVLTRDIRAELMYTLEHPPPPNKYIHIYDETPLESLRNFSEMQVSGLKMSEIRIQVVPPADELGRKWSNTPGTTITFAERLHRPRLNTAQPGELEAEPDAGVRKTSRIKRLSTAIQTFFALEESGSKSSPSGSSFISQRGFGTLAKSMDMPNRPVPSTPPSIKQLDSLKTIPKMPPEKANTISQESVHFVESSVRTFSLTEVDDLRDISDTEEEEERTDTMASLTAEVLSRYLNRNTSAAGDPDAKPAPWKASEPGTSTLRGAQQAGTAQPPTQGSTPLSPYLTTDYMVTRPKTSMEHHGVVDKGERKGESMEMRRKTSRKEARQMGISLIQGDQLRMEVMATLDQLNKIWKSSRNTMIILVVLFACTWLPNLLVRVLSSEPAHLCKSSLSDCWTNIESYAVGCVFFNSTLNAFFYCFGSVHFRKQVKIFFQPCRNRICPKRKKKRPTVRMVRKKVQHAQPLGTGQELKIVSSQPVEQPAADPENVPHAPEQAQSRLGPTSKQAE